MGDWYFGADAHSSEQYDLVTVASTRSAMPWASLAASRIDTSDPDRPRGSGDLTTTGYNGLD